MINQQHGATVVSDIDVGVQGFLDFEEEQKRVKQVV